MREELCTQGFWEVVRPLSDPDTDLDLCLVTPRAYLASASGVWVAADEVYGRNPDLRAFLEERRTGHVMAVSVTDRLATPRGPLPLKEPAVCCPAPPGRSAPRGPAPRGSFYDWALLHGRANRAGVWWVPPRHNRITGELAFHRCYAPEPVPLARLVAVAGYYWRVEESFAQGKGLAGLDEHRVRT